MYWFDTPSVDVGRGQLLTPFWNCFGANACEIDRGTILAMVMQSKSNLLPINTHRRERGLVIGDGYESYQRLRGARVVADLHPCLNINLQTTASAAIEAVDWAFSQSGIDLLKLEVLNEDMVTANDAEVVKAARILAADGFRVMPLVTADPATVAALRALCPLVRVQGSPIGSGRGIDDPAALKECARLAPTILDCGIGSAEHIVSAMQLGCVGFLVDYLLFKDSKPVEAIKDLRHALVVADQPRRPDPYLVGESDWTEEWAGALPPTWPSSTVGSRG